MRYLLLTAFLAVLLWAPAAAQNVYTSEHHNFTLDTVADGLANPWSFVFLPDGEILVSERPGRLRRIVNGTLMSAPVRGLPDIEADGQGGLLDLALHPDFESNQWLYFAYSARQGNGLSTHLARGRYRGGVLTQVEILFAGEPGMRGGRHFGGRLVFDRNNDIYLTIGDRGTQANGQNPQNHAGVTIRLNDDGSVPSDNPFVGTNEGLPEIYTWGNRNGQGLALHPDTGEVWEHEHGPRGGDEINVLRNGSNFGWPEVTFGRNYSGTEITDRTSMPGMEDPLLHWTPSIAPSGMAFYTGNAFPQWQGDLFVGALVSQHMQRLRFNGYELVEQERLLEDFNTRIRAVRSGPDGLLWISTDERNGRLIRLVPAD